MQHSSSSELVTDMLPFYGELYAFLKRQVANAEEAADLTQQTYLRLIRWHREGDREVEYHRGILYKIARNLLIDRSRRHQRSGASEGDELSAADQVAVNPITPARVVEAQDQLETIKQAVSRLPERCRKVFILNRFGHLSYGEIADRLQISRSTVEKHMIKAIAACKRAID